VLFCAYSFLPCRPIRQLPSIQSFSLYLWHPVYPVPGNLQETWEGIKIKIPKKDDFKDAFIFHKDQFEAVFLTISFSRGSSLSGIYVFS
jgi:hypothetical protein